MMFDGSLSRNAQYINEATKEVNLYSLRTHQEASSGANFRISPLPFQPGKPYVNQMKSYSRLLAGWYNQCRKVQNLPKHWTDLIGEFPHEGFGRHLFIRPDFVMTDNGLHCVEIETSPFGFGLSLWLDNRYRELGFDVVGSHTWHEAFPDDVVFLTTEHTSQYNGQMQYISDQLRRYHKRAHVADADSHILSHGTEILYRAFYLYEKGHDLEHLARSRHLPPQELFLETKLPLALAWDDAISVDPILREIILPTWVVKEGFPCPTKSWMDIPELSANNRKYVLKLSGCDEGGSWCEGVYFLHKLSREKCRDLITCALTSSKIFVIQAFVDGRKWEQSWYDFQSDTERVMHGRVRLTPYIDSLNGGILSAKIAMRERTDFIHSATDAIVTTVA